MSCSPSTSLAYFCFSHDSPHYPESVWFFFYNQSWATFSTRHNQTMNNVGIFFYWVFATCIFWQIESLNLHERNIKITYFILLLKGKMTFRIVHFLFLLGRPEQREGSPRCSVGQQVWSAASRFVPQAAQTGELLERVRICRLVRDLCQGKAWLSSVCLPPSLSSMFVCGIVKRNNGEKKWNRL